MVVKKSNKNFLPLIFFSLLFILSLVSPLREILHAFLGQFTTGNSASKTTIFFFLTSIFLSFKIFVNKKSDNKKFIFFLILAFGLSLITHYFLFSYLDLTVNDYVAHASASVDAWEGTYLQHIHTAKMPIYLLEKIISLPLPAHDNGLPIYEIFPYADVFSILLLISWLGLLYFSAKFVSSQKHSTLMAMAASILFIAVGDGGLFSSVSACGFVLLISTYLLEKEFPFKWFIPLAFASFLLSFPLFFFHSNVIFRDWVFPVTFIISSFACFENFGKKEFYFWLILLLMSSFTLVSTSFDSLLGKNSNSFYAYGLPAMTNEEIVSLFNANETTLTHFGWYAAFNTTKTMNTNEMRQKVNSNTYIYFVPSYASSLSQRQILIYPMNATGKEDWSKLVTTSNHFNVSSIEIANPIVVNGFSTLNGPDLALLFVSMLKTNGMDAIVISKVV